MEAAARRRFRLVVTIALGLGAAGPLAACSLDDGHPPVARVRTDPTAIPENDGFQTAVTLDSTLSADPVDDPDGQAPLEIEWHIGNDDFRFEEGNEGSPAPVVRFRGDRPPSIQLTVTDADGLSSTVTIQLRLTVTL